MEIGCFLDPGHVGIWNPQAEPNSLARWHLGTPFHSSRANHIYSSFSLLISQNWGFRPFMASIWSRLVMTLGPFAPSWRPWTHPAFAKALGRVSRECSQRKKWPSPPRKHILHRLSVHFQETHESDPIQIVVSEHRDTWSLIDDDHGILKYPRSQGKPK